MRINKLRRAGGGLGDVPFGPVPTTPPFLPTLAPVAVDIPDPVITGLPDESGVSIDDSGMSVVTVVADKPGIPTWVWWALAVGAYYWWGRK